MVLRRLQAAFWRLPAVKAHVHGRGLGAQIEWSGEVQHISWQPRVFLYKKFLSDQECDHLMTKGASGLAPSEVRSRDIIFVSTSQLQTLIKCSVSVCQRLCTTQCPIFIPMLDSPISCCNGGVEIIGVIKWSEQPQDPKCSASMAHPGAGKILQQ